MRALEYSPGSWTVPVPVPATHTLAAHRFRALGDETRLWLLELLGAGERSVAELMDATELGQSLVSHHLRALRDAGLVTTRRDGRWIFYAIDAAALASAKLALYELG
jgi:ArsR family transcriptional regulator